MVKKFDKSKLYSILIFAAIIIVSFTVRIAGTQRTKSVDYHPDEWVLAQPVQVLANKGHVGEKAHYKWPGCGVIYPVGYGMYYLKSPLKQYTYDEVLKILRVLSALASMGTVVMIFLFLRKYHSIRAGFIGALLFGISRYPAIVGHYGTLDSMTMLMFITGLYFIMDFFKVGDNPKKFPIIKSLLLGALLGWGIAVKWTLLLMAIPVFIALVFSFVESVKAKDVPIFLRRVIPQCFVTLVGLVIGFLVMFPEFIKVHDRAIEGIRYEMKHHNTGHYGTVLEGSMDLAKKFRRVYDHLNKCGWKAIGIAGMCSVLFVFFRRSKLKWYLLCVFLLWTYVPFRNLIAPPRHFLVPYVIMLLFLAIFVDYLMSVKVKFVKIPTMIVFTLICLASLLYTCVSISPFWMDDPRYTCAEWIMKNVPKGSGVTWAPRHNVRTWAVPGTRIAGFLFDSYPRIAESGKYQYYVVCPSVLGTFKHHPPTRPINPDEWFPSEPPTQTELQFFYELNKEDSPYFEKISKFRLVPNFLGIEFSFFGESSQQYPTYACQPVMLFKSRQPMQKNN